MITKTEVTNVNKKLSDEFDKAMEINNCGLPSGTWIADILVHAETGCTWIRKSSNIPWSKISGFNDVT